MTDRLVSDLRAHRPAALEELLATHGRQIQGVAYLILHSWADAEEVLIDTMMAAWEQSRQLRDPGALRPWLLRIAARKALSRRRRSRAADPLALHTISLSDPTNRVSERLAVSQAVRELPPRMRAAVALRYYGDLTVDEVAKALGRSPNTVKSELRVALIKLRATLGGDTDRLQSSHAP
ncbi:MAG: RNA polymerase sigma factor [Candidatus Limnocylindria bacterium]